jgi:DNA helicase-2/ATP-dependent DNA helicase PcrA
MTKEKYGLNDEQWMAIIAKSPAIINASAGSGKTRCLISKIRYLIDSGNDPKSILAVTFTNKAAKEMKERLKPYCPDIKDMQISTIHSLCVRIMREYITYTVLNMPFSIYDDSDQLSVVKTIIKSRNLTLDPYEALSAISRAKSDSKGDELTDELGLVYKQYNNILWKNNACDFDDLLIYALDCLKHEDCKEYYQDLWTHVLVDECQDTSTIQYNILLSFFNPETTKTMMLIGDQNQSIYGWRSARPENMQDFITQYKATSLGLTYNYRSCPEIIAHANSYLQFGKPMVAKSQNQGKVSVTVFSSQDDEANKIADALLKMGNYENTAILYRMNSRSLLFERAFAQKRIPYKVVGTLPFYKRRVSKDLLAYLKASSNLSDLESLVRIVNVPKRGFGEAKKEKLLTEGRPYLQAIGNDMPEIKSFIEILEDIKDKKPLDAINEVLLRTKYRDMAETDADMIDAMLNVAAGFDSINELILASTFLEEDSGNGVKLMSAHASKGLEFDRVFVVGVEQDVWPHKNSLDMEEENRLFFVAASRAKFYLNVSYSMNRMFRGIPMQTFPSPLFLSSQQKLQGTQKT